MLEELGISGWELVVGMVVKNDRSWCRRVEFVVTKSSGQLAMDQWKLEASTRLEMEIGGSSLEVEGSNEPAVLCSDSLSLSL